MIQALASDLEYAADQIGGYPDSDDESDDESDVKGVTVTVAVGEIDSDDEGGDGKHVTGGV